MLRTLTTLFVLVGLMTPVLADETGQKKESREKSEDVMMIPRGVNSFNGVLVGRLVSKDVEKGTFVMIVDAIPRIWRNSKATKPKSLLRKKVQIDGVFGKWLDVLLLVRPGETLEIEARHDGGQHLTFPGELLRKVAPVKPGDYPELPEDFRGFRGLVVGKIVKKDSELMELILEVKQVKEPWKNNKAKNPKSIEGKKIMLAGFWQRKEAYHNAKVGQTVEVGLQHPQVRSDHMTFTEIFRQVD